MVCSIFIASRMSSGCPFFTRAPASTITWITFPGMGAASEPAAAASSGACSSALSASRR